MKRYLALAAGIVVALVVACGDSEETPDSRSDTSDGGIDFALASEGTTLGTFGVTTVEGTAGTLPGITVVGSGEVKAEPDRVRVRLTVGSGDEYFGPGGPTLEIVKKEELEPVVNVLKDEGVSEEDISVTTFALGIYDPYAVGAAQVTFVWPRPADLESMLEMVQETVRRETDYSLQNMEVLFSLSDCEPVEEEAVEAAFEDARRRAERLASLADISIGDIVAVSEAPGLLGLYAGPTGCDALEEFPSLDYYSAAGSGSPSEVTISVTLQVTFAIQ
jgi:uncharacterized protein YggE